MSNVLDMTLDDLIKNNKRSGGGNARGRGRGSGTGPTRRLPSRDLIRSAPYNAAKAPSLTWEHDMFTDQGMAYSAATAVRAPNIETGTKLYISNLDYEVSDDDVKELFTEVGDLKRYTIHYDRSGRSKGTAEVVFSRRSDAVAAVKRYNNVQLDGKPMKIEIVGTNAAAPAFVPFMNGVNDTFGNSVGISSFGNSVGMQRRETRGVGGGRGRGGLGAGGRGRGRGRGRGGGEKVVSADELDADLAKYHADSMMQIN